MQVYPSCVAQKGQVCYHWTIQSYSAKPGLMTSTQILKDESFMKPTLKTHFTSKQEKSNEKSNELCGNPWNHFSEEECVKIRATAPKSNPFPTNGQRALCQSRIVSYEETCKWAQSNLDADCWSIFTRDPITHNVLKTIYFLERIDSKTSDEILFGERPKTIKPLIDTLKDQSLELCISMFGSIPGCDMYIQYVAPNRYLVVTVDERDSS